MKQPYEITDSDGWTTCIYCKFRTRYIGTPLQKNVERDQYGYWHKESCEVLKIKKEETDD